MRIFTGVVGTETNSFAPLPTRFEDFVPVEPRSGKSYHPYGMVVKAVRDRAAARGHDVIVGRGGFATPGGLTTKKAYERLRANMLEDLKAALPVDIVCIGLHGAMIAEGYDDPEGDLLAQIRALVGPKVVIGAELDLHGHLTDLKKDSADILVFFKEYPHTDIYERGLETFDLCLAAAQGKIKPEMSVVDCKLLSMFHTTREPMQSFVRKMEAAEREPDILSISFVHSFPWGDCQGLGAKMLVISNDAKDKGDALARAFADEIIALREKFNADYLAPADALRIARETNAAPVVIADSADNPGGGSAGDATFMLAELLAQKVESACFGPLWDAGALDLCFAAGEGARLPLRIGGKTSPASGAPLDVEAEILRCVDKADQINPFGRGGATSMGRACAIRVDGVEIVLVAERQQALGDIFTPLGIDWRAKKNVIVKSSQHFYAAYAPDAARVLYVETPASMSMNWKALPYRNRPHGLWPLDG